jgi:hypothetical protein
MPRSFAYRGRRVQTDRFLVTQEVVEKALSERTAPSLSACAPSCARHRGCRQSGGIAWRDYNRFTKANEKKIGDERLVRVPRDLDLTPYRDEHDLPELWKMIAASSAPGKGD